MNEKDKELLLKTPKDKLEVLAKDFEKNPETEDLSVILFVIAGSTLLGKDAMKSLALWNATWADSVINEVNKIREEEVVDDLTNKIIPPNDQ
tara:strand:+ start:435 stop:710 length:276 start_codon:yes stop_codon:yes gene_type:complete